jgi:hypothetical protein
MLFPLSCDSSVGLRCLTLLDSPTSAFGASHSLGSFNFTTSIHAREYHCIYLDVGKGSYIQKFPRCMCSITIIYILCLTLCLLEGKSRSCGVKGYYTLNEWLPVPTLVSPIHHNLAFLNLIAAIHHWHSLVLLLVLLQDDRILTLIAGGGHERDC